MGFQLFSATVEVNPSELAAAVNFYRAAMAYRAAGGSPYGYRTLTVLMDGEEGEVTVELVAYASHEPVMVLLNGSRPGPISSYFLVVYRDGIPRVVQARVDLGRHAMEEYAFCLEVLRLFAGFERA